MFGGLRPSRKVNKRGVERSAIDPDSGGQQPRNPMTASTLQHPKLFHFLTAIDEDLAARRRLLGCSLCGGVLLRGLSAQATRCTLGATWRADDPPQLLLPELPMQEQAPVGPLSRATGLSGLHRDPALHDATRCHGSRDRRAAQHPGRGTPNAATLAPLVARGLCSNPTVAIPAG